MKITVISANEWVYPDIFDYESAASSVELHAPRGSWASAQLQIPGTVPGDAIELLWEGTLPFEGFRMLDVTVERNSGDEYDWAALEPGTPKPDYCTRQAPFPVFDILQPLTEGGDRVEKETTALYVCWQIPRDAVPGIYEGTLTVKIGSETAAVPVKITVHAVQTPEKSRLSITNWYTLNNVGKYYGLEKGTDGWFEMLAKFYRLMHRTRQTHILIPMDVDVTEKGNGTFAFGFDRMERTIRLAVEMGFQTLELGHLCVKNYVELEKYWLFYKPEDRKIYADSPEGYNFLAQFLPAWVDFLRKNGWYDMAVQHVGDEPVEGQVDDYRIICGTVRKFMPGMKLFDAVCNLELAGSVDCWVLQNQEYQLHREKYEHFRALGDDLWQYTCCCPGGKWLNRLLDGELLKPRLLHYGNYLFNLAGYLHWGFNYYQGGMDHLRQKTCGLSDNKVSYWPAGDTNICYPGNENGPWMSVRAERMRSGAEDCELLWMISDRDKAKADALCTNVMQSFNEYETGIAAFESNYVKLLETADSLL